MGRAAVERAPSATRLGRSARAEEGSRPGYRRREGFDGGLRSAPWPRLGAALWGGRQPNCTDRFVKALSIHHPVMGNEILGRPSAAAPAATSSGA